MKFQLMVATVLLATLATASSAAFGADRSQGKTNVPRGKIVVLAYDAGTNGLVKAYAQALYRSRDEGRDWEPIALPKAAERGNVNAVSVSAHDQRTLYVAGTGLGVLGSTDGGKTWVARNDGLPTKDIVALSSHADQAQTVYAHAPGYGVFRSEDAGWRDAGALGRGVTAVAYDPQRTNQIYAATADGLFVSADGGEQWSHAQSPGKVTALVVTRAGVLYAAAGDGQLFRSADHGATWQPVDA